MQAVILAGGRGTRLWPVTREVPKPMVHVAGRPYLEHQLRLLRHQGITDVVLLTGYLGEQIEEHFGDGGRLGLDIRYSREATPLGTGGALREARPLFRDTFLLIYGDSYLPIRYGAVLQALEDPAALGVMVVYDSRGKPAPARKNVAVDAAGFVSRYDKDAADEAQLDYVDAGVLAFRRSLLAFLPAVGEVSLEKYIYPCLVARRQLLARVTGQRFYDIGTPERLQVIESYLSHDHYQDAVSR
ncbi:MAG TPA: sugar phosphate nucleotidyltransferase [Gemmataceae bacterium]|jgi:NDP-sugar pyrophosphorylase family protein|nr:sugar phosphate nucleotidyltransferase [Gemmataceae bacterium]